MVGEGRTAPRAKLLLSAQLRVSGARPTDVTIRNLSATGALLEAKHIPGKGAEIEICRGDLAAAGTVAWVKPGRCGIRFHEPIDLVAWLPTRMLSAGQQRVDEIQIAIRAGTNPPPSEPDSVQRLQRAIAARVAEELAYVSRMLESLGEELATDLMAARHAAKLQDLDIATQILGHLGNVLTAQDAAGAIKQIGMEELRRRLSRKEL